MKTRDGNDPGRTGRAAESEGPAGTPEPDRWPKRRRSRRYLADLRVSTETIDPVRDPATGETFFHTSDHDQLVDLSRTGLRLRAERAPSVGTRVLLRLHLPNDAPLELVGRARWTRVELEPGSSPKRAVCGVGFEVLGGSRHSLDRYENLLADLDSEPSPPVAGNKPLG